MGHCFDRDGFQIKELAAEYSRDIPELFTATSYVCAGVDFVLEGTQYQEEFLGSLFEEKNPGKSKPAVYLSSEAYVDISKTDKTRLLIKTPLVGKEVALDKQATVGLFNDLVKIDSVDSIKNFVAKYGRLRELDAKLGTNPLPILCDTVKEWTDFLSDVWDVLRVWDLIGRGNFGQVPRSDLLGADLHAPANISPDEFKRIYANITALEARSCLAHMLNEAFRGIKVRTTHKIMTNGQIISLECPLDLYSLVWTVIANSIKDTPGEGHIRKCYFCGLYHDEQDMVYMRVRANPSIGKVWYSPKCKDVDKMRRYRAKKNMEAGRVAKPRPGARKF